jgi:NTE family protein
MKLGLALGGGGAKGLAHIGVLEELESHGIVPHYVAGTSIGSIIGAVYALEGSTTHLRARAQQMIESDEFKDFGLGEFYTADENIFERFKKEVFEKFYFGRLFFLKSHIKSNAAGKLFRDLFGDRTFRDCKIHFACNALDIQTGEEIVFTSGLIRNAVWASCAIPGILPPYHDGDRILVDGGVVDNVPVEPVKMLGARIIIASYLGHRLQYEGEPDTGFRISQRAQSFVRYYLDQKILEQADCVITPDVARFHWADFSPLSELVAVGKESVIEKLSRVQSVMSRWYRFKRYFR